MKTRFVRIILSVGTVGLLSGIVWYFTFRDNETGKVSTNKKNDVIVEFSEPPHLLLKTEHQNEKKVKSPEIIEYENQISNQASSVLATLRERSKSEKSIGLNAYSGLANDLLRSSTTRADIGRMGGVQTLDKKEKTTNEVQFYRAPEFNTEEYKKIDDNKFTDVKNQPLSTFSIDVDAASYSNVRRFLKEGNLPYPDAVRIEEMINYFNYDYPQPSGENPFSITTESAVCPWNSNHQLVMIGLQGKKLSLENIPPNNLVFLLDVSGSMDSPDKLPLVKSAFKLLVQQLHPQDKVSIVVYAGSSGLVLPPTNGKHKSDILSSLDNLKAGGSTAGGEGIELAYKTAKENFIDDGNNRVILATDGDFNVGVSSDGELIRLIEKKRNQGIFLSVLGFGTGNIKDSKMEQLADKGNGHYAYIDDMMEAKKVFVNELGGTLVTIAKDVKLQLEFNPAKIQSYRLIGYENRLLASEDFNDDKKDAGELGSGHSVTALYEVVLADTKKDVAVSPVDPLKYQKERQAIKSENSGELLTVKFRYKKPTENESLLLTSVLRAGNSSFESSSVNFQFASSVAEFGMLLRDSEFKGKSSFDHVIKTAKLNKGTDEDGYRSEFIQLVEMAKSLSIREVGMKE